MISSTGSPILSSHLILIWLSSLPLILKFAFSAFCLLSPFGSHLTVPNSSLNPFLTYCQASWHTQVANKLLPLHRPQASSLIKTNAPQMGPTFAHITAHHISLVISTTISLCRSFHWFLCWPPYQALCRSLHHSSFSHPLRFLFHNVDSLNHFCMLNFIVASALNHHVRPYYSPFICIHQ